MAQYKITILPQNIEVLVDEGTNLLDAQIKAGLHPDAPCGGKGTCGKCLVNVLEGEPKGVQKACLTKVTSDMTINAQSSDKHSILLDGVKRQISIAPAIKSYNIAVDKCVIGDSHSDWFRLKQAVAKAADIPAESIPVSVPIISNLYQFLQDNDYVINAVLCENRIIELRAADDPIYLMAFDIGTTTIVGYLLDAKTGENKATASMLNPQSQYGADVIERSNHALSNGVENLSALVRGALNDLIEAACKKASINREEIYMISVVGNTCMHHLFTGISPGALVHSPYNPSVSESMMLPASHYGIDINKKGQIMLLPNIAGFVGADTVGVLLATEFDKMDKLSLMIDIGTNGEMVMGTKDRMIACSTAAGPAFEGAKIACGMRGAKGAIDHLSFEGTKLTYSTIDNAKPIGLCGSGLMDIVTILLENGLIDEMGRLLDEDELETEVAEANADRLVMLDEKTKVFILATAEESGNGEPVYISQKDIREVQLAKSAMAAGITLLADTLGVKTSDIQQVLIAGAFGNYMAPHSACAIGMIPPELESRIVPIGNGAGEGSKIAILNQEEFYRSERIARNCEFLELATHPDFNDCYVDGLEFPEQDF
ncbi:Acetyl-CoA synthase corrinoid activation protein [Lachnospiraceae bacterium TWA4]|nr:Acetyl-CoA synthase corrinoid activation protein [Lachnospiraceae bacterium TWA4]